MTRSTTTVVACLGDSITRGWFSFDWVGRLTARLGPSGYDFRNFGRNGDLVYDALRRLDSVVAADPQFVAVLLGTNDVNATMSKLNRRRYVRGNRLPQDPTLGWFRECLEQILKRLRERTAARVALLSLPVLSEDLGHPANQKTAAYSETVREVAAVGGAAYLPLHERQRDYLLAHPGPPGLAYQDGLAAFIKAAARRYLLRQDWDDISRRNGLRLTIDGIHLNSTGGGMVADLVEQFLCENSTASPSAASAEPS
jgi:lysophospholipase L1-like esterase